MAEAMESPFRPWDTATPAGTRAPTGNAVPLRWTPGPDELRLPSEGDEPTPKTSRQSLAIAECAESLRLHWLGRQDVFVGSDQFLYWDRSYDPETDSANPPPSPHVYVVFGVANRLRESYVAWEEGKPPDFVLEMVPPWSRRQDERELPPLYAKIGVPEFFIHDPDGKLEPALAGFELQGGAYQPLPTEPLARGVEGIRSKRLGLCLYIRPNADRLMESSLGWYDPAAGEFPPTRYELEASARAAEAAATEAEAAAREAEAAARESEAAARESEAAARESEAVAKLAESEARVAESEARVAELKAQLKEMRRERG